MTSYYPHLGSRSVNNKSPNWRRSYHEGIAAHYEQLRKDRHGARTSEEITIRGRTETVDFTTYQIAYCSDDELGMIARRLAERDLNRAIHEYELARKRHAA